MPLSVIRANYMPKQITLACFCARSSPVRICEPRVKQNLPTVVTRVLRLELAKPQHQKLEKGPHNNTKRQICQE